MNIRAFIGAFEGWGGTFLRSRWSFLIIETRLFKIKITFSRYRPPFLTIDVLFTTHFLKIRVIFWFLRTLFNDWWLLSISRLGFWRSTFADEVLFFDGLFIFSITLLLFWDRPPIFRLRIRDFHNPSLFNKPRDQENLRKKLKTLNYIIYNPSHTHSHTHPFY